MAAQRWVDAMAAGQPAWAMALYAAPAEFAKVFDGPQAEYEAMYGKVNAGSARHPIDAERAVLERYPPC